MYQKINSKQFQWNVMETLDIQGVAGDVYRAENAS